VDRSGLGQHVAKLLESFGYDSIPHPCSSSISIDKAGFVEHFEVVADGRLRFADRFDEVARADLAFGRNQRQDPEPHWIAEGGERRRELLGVAFFQRRVENGRATHCDRT
jgi:hypothetical protein